MHGNDRYQTQEKKEEERDPRRICRHFNYGNDFSYRRYIWQDWNILRFEKN